MAEAEAPAHGGGPLQAITRKVGPLPVWAYAAILLLAYVLYRHFKGGTTSSSPSTSTSSTDATGASTYMPGFDASGAGGGGGIGSTTSPSTVNNYYYGDQAALQASGGGTSPVATGIDLTSTGPSGVMTPAGGDQIYSLPPIPATSNGGSTADAHLPETVPLQPPAPVTTPTGGGTTPVTGLPVTGTGTTPPVSTPPHVDIPLGQMPNSPAQFQVPVSTQLGAGGARGSGVQGVS